jgi:inhibitor of KinA
MDFRILDAGDTALTIELGDRLDRHLLAAVTAVDEALAKAIAGGYLPGIVETVPTFRSLTVIYDPLLTSRAEIEPGIRAAIAAAVAVSVRRGRLWQLPVCYGDQIATCGPDLEALAEACDLTPAEVVRLHSTGTYEVYMLGFLPGFPFMGDLPEVLARPAPQRAAGAGCRRGSVAMAGTLTAIYPWESPGGWHLIGACPLPLFSVAWPQAALLLPGDRVCWRPIDAAEYHSLSEAMPAMSASPLPPGAFLLTDEAPR